LAEVVVGSYGLLGVDFADAALEAAVRGGLERTEALLRDAVDSHDALVAQAARHLVQAGGKRFRPLLTLLAAQFGPEHAADDVVVAAVVVELTHLATLYHDDVMDEATVRRGAPSANLRWDNTIAILTGDFLFARASGLVAGLGRDAVRIQAETFERLVTGQIRETAGPDGTDADPIAHHLSVLADKTGSLIATAARFGALFGAADDAAVAGLQRYGELIGVAFQLSDDLLDVASTTVQSGKTPGTDLREGVRTLPMLYALASDDPGGARLRELLAESLTDDVRHAEALSLLRASPAMARARRTLGEYTDRARAELASLPDVAARRALESLADFVVARTG
jgi:heptaprenyl diphosphate synthase